MRNKKKTIINCIIFIALIVITYYIIFREQNLHELYQNIKSLNMFYLIVAIFVMLLYFGLEAYNVKTTLRSFNSNISLSKMFKYTLIGFFFSSITPGATGGQPMEIYYLTKEKIPIAQSTISLLLHICGFHISSILLGIIGLIINPNILNNNLFYFFIAGTLLNTIPISITIIGIFFPNILSKIIGIIIKILKRFKVKNANKISSKLNNEISIYQESSEHVRNSGKTVSKSLFISLIQAIVYYVVPFFVYKSFGLEEATIIDFVLIQAILHSTVCSMPLPGSVGVTETVYLLIYGLVYPANLLQSSMLVNRFINFYLFVFISLLVYIFTKIKLDKQKSNQTK